MTTATLRCIKGGLDDRPGRRPQQTTTSEQQPTETAPPAEPEDPWAKATGDLLQARDLAIVGQNGSTGLQSAGNYSLFGVIAEKIQTGLDYLEATEPGMQRRAQA